MMYVHSEFMSESKGASKKRLSKPGMSMTNVVTSVVATKTAPVSTDTAEQESNDTAVQELGISGSSKNEEKIPRTKSTGKKRAKFSRTARQQKKKQNKMRKYEEKWNAAKEVLNPLTISLTRQRIGLLSQVMSARDELFSHDEHPINIDRGFGPAWQILEDALDRWEVLTNRPKCSAVELSKRVSGEWDDDEDGIGTDATFGDCCSS